LSILLTLVGIGLCFWWRHEGDIVHAGPLPTFARSRADEPDERGDDDGATAQFGVSEVAAPVGDDPVWRAPPTTATGVEADDTPTASTGTAWTSHGESTIEHGGEGDAPIDR